MTDDLLVARRTHPESLFGKTTDYNTLAFLLKGTS